MDKEIKVVNGLMVINGLTAYDILKLPGCPIQLPPSTHPLVWQVVRYNAHNSKVLKNNRKKKSRK